MTIYVMIMGFIWRIKNGESDYYIVGYSSSRRVCG